MIRLVSYQKRDIARDEEKRGDEQVRSGSWTDPENLNPSRITFLRLSTARLVPSAIPA